MNCLNLSLLQAITKGFFADFPPAVKEAAEPIVNARYVQLVSLVLMYYSLFIVLKFMVEWVRTCYLLQQNHITSLIWGIYPNAFKVMNYSILMYYVKTWLSITGVLQADPGIIREHTQIFRLFCHECQRVFHDRLIDKTDKDYFNGILSEMSLKHFSKVHNHINQQVQHHVVVMLCVGHCSW